MFIKTGKQEDDGEKGYLRNLALAQGLTEADEAYFIARPNGSVGSIIPEPATVAGLVFGIGSLATYLRRRRTR